MKTRTRKLAALLLGLFAPLLSHACGGEGEGENLCSAGVVLYIVFPLGLAGVLVTVILCTLKKFRRPALFFSYLSTFLALALVAPFLCRHDSVYARAMVAGVFAVFLLPVLVPACIQYWRRGKHIQAL